MAYHPLFRDDEAYRSPWVTLLRTLGGRAAILFVVLAVGLWVSWPVVWGLCQPAVYNLVGLILWALIAAVLGFVAAGWCVRGVWRDVELGRLVKIAAMLAAVTLAEVGAFTVAAALHGVPVAGVVIPSCTLVLWSWAAVWASALTGG